MLPDPVAILKKSVPIYRWANDYNVDKAIADLVAGITVGLTLIPQSLAYASLAGLDPQYGLYSSLCGGLTYVVFGTIPELNIAPTALLSLLTFSYTQNLSFSNVQAATFLCFWSGIIELLCGVLHLGFLVDFVSTPVVAAFTSAGAITIASSQVKNLLGVKFSAESFTSVWRQVFEHIGETRMWDAVLGFGCCAVLLLMRKLKDLGQAPLEPATKSEQSIKHNPNHLKKLLWFFSVARNAFVVISCAFLAFLLASYNKEPFSQTSDVPSGWPNVSLPPFEVETMNNTVLNFMGMVKEIGSGIIVVPFVAILGNVAIAKAFAHGKVVDASQEMIAVGLCNIFGSFFGSYPVNASFSRAAVSSASGVRTPLAGIYTGAMVILAFTFLTQYFAFIPKATLAAVIICAVLFMVEIVIVKMIWVMNKIELLPFFVTLISCLFLGIEVGILVGICVDILLVLYTVARPRTKIDTVILEHYAYLKITPTANILFPSAEYLREKVLRSVDRERNPVEKIVINCHHVNKLDYTAAKCLGALVNDLDKSGYSVYIVETTEQVAKILETSGAKNFKMCETEMELRNCLEQGKHVPISIINITNNPTLKNDNKMDTTPL